jgi:hypothetical protein
MQLYIKISLQLPSNTLILLIPEQWEQKQFNFTLPVLSSTSTENLATSLLITAYNSNNGQITLTKSLIVNNTLDVNFRSTLYSKATDYFGGFGF